MHLKIIAPLSACLFPHGFMTLIHKERSSTFPNTHPCDGHQIKRARLFANAHTPPILDTRVWPENFSRHPSRSRPLETTPTTTLVPLDMKPKALSFPNFPIWATLGGPSPFCLQRTAWVPPFAHCIMLPPRTILQCYYNVDPKRRLISSGESAWGGAWGYLGALAYFKVHSRARLLNAPRSASISVAISCMRGSSAMEGGRKGRGRTKRSVDE